MRISDWSSDVCSSDLPVKIAAQLWPLDQIADGYERLLDIATARLHKLQNSPGTDDVTMTSELAAEFTRAMETGPLLQIGRASCRERVCPSVCIPVAVGSSKKNMQKLKASYRNK